jgi:glycosyltransferase involved in cell wall biosynthesis
VECDLKIAMISPVAWRTPPRHYGPWERVVSLLTEALLARGTNVTLFATGDSQSSGQLRSICRRGYEEDQAVLPKVLECLHIAEVFEHASEFDIIHNHFDFLPLTYSGLVDTPVLTTIHGFSSPRILPVYRKYDGRTAYVSISDADRDPELDYIATVHHGIDLGEFTFNDAYASDYLLFFGRIHGDKGAREAIQIAKVAGIRLVMAGIVQDQDYFRKHVEPHLDSSKVTYVGNADPSTRDQLLGGALALLHPIQFDEPFGLSVVEAMACGTPVIAFDRGSMPELIRHGETGFLVEDVASAVAAVARLHDLDRRDCRAWVEQRFTAERMAADYVQVYEQVLSR